ncbi:nuclear intron maturase 3, mitochondrial [Macadamia integrifolia]|uniref:nuclear intron maturase 3, mitochondrial n=1 Tax=Macadamia integrifolia TaxID=60698 RepID=UPI001C50139C|nr:nuclear intron maturase 3, mitochondrial [Macadamia integrifolia]
MRLNLGRVISSKTRVSAFSCLRFYSVHLNGNSSHAPEISEFESCTKPISRADLETLVLQQYRHGKFSDLITNVVSVPSVLLAASDNLCPRRGPNGENSSDSSLYASVSRRFSVERTACELRENRFDVKACCFRMLSSRKKGDSLVLPNLKLKVVIEAVRLVLEIVYDERFATFAYGGRVGMGRHTAIRYLKHSVQNPNWWFHVCFHPHKFDAPHLRKLSSFIQAKIEDKLLIDLIWRFFESEAVRIEFGGSSMGRGFPQESNLAPILINVYFNSLDKEMQDLRTQMASINPKFDPSESSLPPSRVFHKPVKMYAIRYLDEILVITSGSKPLTIDLMNQIVEFLEGILELKVDRLKTTIHSAVSERIAFLGMELQAVPPSVLHPPLSDKAIRARKKYIKQKEGRALELRNARETRRKKLGLKILNHVFKKLKRAEGFKFDFHIEMQVRDIFRGWADEVVQEFLGSLEERSNWHRKLSYGDFLTLKDIRNQLPQQLVDAYDQFEEQVNKFLNPVQARKALEEEARRIEEEERKSYSRSTLEDLTKLCIRVAAPIHLVRKAVKLAGFTNSMGRPRPIKLLIPLEDTDIIKWYAGVGRRWLDFFCCCRNFSLVKTVVTYHLRFSCLLTLAEKHESTKREAIKHYTKDLKVSDATGLEEVHFPTEREIKMMGDNNLSDPKPVDGTLSMTLIRLVSDESPCSCVAHFCNRTDVGVYRIRLLQNRLNVNPLNEDKWVPGMGAIHESLNRKCLQLCSDHSNDLYLGKISLQDIDCTSFLDVH